MQNNFGLIMTVYQTKIMLRTMKTSENENQVQFYTPFATLLVTFNIYDSPLHNCSQYVNYLSSRISHMDPPPLYNALFTLQFPTNMSRLCSGDMVVSNVPK